MSGLPSKSASGGDAAISYEESRERARASDVDTRKALAGRADVRTEILYYLAEDPSPAVRREIAQNTASPAQADVLLARDADVEVRCELAQKIARLAPDLTAEAREKVWALTVEALEILAADEITRVRQALAEALKDVAEAPGHVIQRLARDAELAVAAPVLEFSPLLSDEDLREIIASTTESGARCAISRRRDVSERVSDAIVDSRDEAAVAALLANPSAQIREETLDWIVEGSREVEPWQMPLVKRPALPRRAIRKLAAFVTDSVLAMLHRRDDLDPETAGRIDKAVRERLDGAAADKAELGSARKGEAAEAPDPENAAPSDRNRTAEIV